MPNPETRAPLQEGLRRAEQLQFEQDGFLLQRGLCPPALLQRIREEMEGLHERMALNPVPGTQVSWEPPQEGRPKRIRQLMHSERVVPGLNTFLRSKPVLDRIEALLGPEIVLFHSKLLMKAARDGSVTPWHQDYAYWKGGGNRPVQVNAMLAIDPATRENGCLQFVPGSHRQGLVGHEREKGIAFGVYLPGYFQERADARCCPMDAGDVVFFGSLVIHGSAGNPSPHDRRANTVAYTTPGDRPDHCRETLRGASLRSPNPAALA